MLSISTLVLWKESRTTTPSFWNTCCTSYLNVRLDSVDLPRYHSDDTPSPTPSTIVYRATGRRFPRLFALYSDLLPTKEEKRFMNFRDESKGIARKLLDEKYEAGDLDKDAKDILSVLGKYFAYQFFLSLNLSTSSSQRRPGPQKEVD